MGTLATDRADVAVQRLMGADEGLNRSAVVVAPDTGPEFGSSLGRAVVG
ncbi:hypothetical protein [Brevundimonas sp. TWP2-3-2]